MAEGCRQGPSYGKYYAVKQMAVLYVSRPQCRRSLLSPVSRYPILEGTMEHRRELEKEASPGASGVITEVIGRQRGHMASAAFFVLHDTAASFQS